MAAAAESGSVVIRYPGGKARSASFCDAPKQLLVLQLVLHEAQHRSERGLVAEAVRTPKLQHLGVDAAFDQAEEIRVGAALHLTEQTLLSFVEERQLRHQR
jgi:hypothetical protein